MILRMFRMLLVCLLSLVVNESSLMAQKLDIQYNIVLPDIKELSRELRVDIRKLKKQADILSGWVLKGYRPETGRTFCALPDWENVCKIFDNYVAGRKKRRTYKRSYRRSRKRLRVVKKNIGRLQETRYGSMKRSVRRMPRKKTGMIRTVQWGLSKKVCPANFSAFLFLRMGSYLPDKKILKLMDNLYDQILTCIDEDHEVYEIVNLRYALTNYFRNKKRAFGAIKKAVNAKRKNEEFRSLFWAGLLSQELGKEGKKNNSFWRRLLEKYPINFYSILVRSRLGVKVEDSFKESLSVQDSFSYLRRSAVKKRLNRNIAWLEVLFITGKKKAFKRWGDWIIATAYGSESELSLYLALLFRKARDFHSSISMMFRYFRRNPEKISMRTLRLFFPAPHRDLFTRYSGEIDQFIFMGIARQESAFEPLAVSRANARGLLQIRPSTARRLERVKSRKLFSPDTNIRIGIKFFRKLLDRYDNNVALALAAYNAGPTKVKKWLTKYPTENKLLFVDSIPYRETRDYVTSVLRDNYWYRVLYGEENRLTERRIESSFISNFLKK